MKRIGPAALSIAAIVGVVLGFLTDQLLTATKQPTFTPAVTLPIVLVLMGAFCLIFAWPIRQQVRGKKRGRVDALRAFRTVTFARAASVTGAFAVGFTVGLLLFILTRPADPPVGSITLIGVTIAAGIVLVVCALIAESFCVLPKDDDDDPAGLNAEP